MILLSRLCRTIQTKLWWTLAVAVVVTMIAEVTSLSGPNVCMVKQKYNITKRVKYRAPMSVRTYEWCFAMPPRCSKWNTEMRDVTRLETEERTAEMAVCCAGYKLKDISCVPICPSGKTGLGCSEECPHNKWGPNCVHDCKVCDHGSCDAATGECRCHHGWQGESCDTSLTTTAVPMMEQLLTTSKTFASTKTTQTMPTSTEFITSTSTTTSQTNNTTTRSSRAVENEVTTTPKSSTSITKGEQWTVTNKSAATQEHSATDNNVTLSTSATIVSIFPVEVTKNIFVLNSNYNRTEIPTESTKPDISEVMTYRTKSTMIEIKTNPSTSSTIKTSLKITEMATTLQPTATVINVTKELTAPTKTETKKIESTVRPTTTKFKPKEIWIRPAQKGDSPIIESKLRVNQDLPHSKIKSKDVNDVTTPKTIIVSIIPTSVSYVTFKKLAFTTASTIFNKNMMTKVNNRSSGYGLTKPVSEQTTQTPVTIKILQKKTSMPSTTWSPLLPNVTKINPNVTLSPMETFRTIVPVNKTTNSMLSTLNVANKRLNSSLLTTISSLSTNASTPLRRQHSSQETSTSKLIPTVPALFQNKTISVLAKTAKEHLPVIEHLGSIKNKKEEKEQNINESTSNRKVTNNGTKNQTDTNTKREVTSLSTNSNTVTDNPKDEESFHILTEPEHITAVMNDKGTDRSTIDLISVISIAGGVMMAVITVAVVIVMLDRCKKPRYEDVRKYNDIRMQVMIDNTDDVPPPYVRSIFHTPLPDPPIEKCHYQPISTLDRNLKQFMRPVVVQTISPLMLENFRGILECHYDHLPRRSQDLGTMETRCSVAPSIDEREELLSNHIRTLTDSDIEAMKCEAKLDVIDNTTSEPLYAEIPCWRPPSARAIEVVNLNGEAVTEL